MSKTHREKRQSFHQMVWGKLDTETLKNGSVCDSQECDHRVLSAGDQWEPRSDCSAVPCWKRKHRDLGRTHTEALNKLHGYSGSRTNADMGRRRSLLSQDTFY